MLEGIALLKFEFIGFEFRGFSHCREHHFNFVYLGGKIEVPSESSMKSLSIITDYCIFIINNSFHF